MDQKVLQRLTTITTALVGLILFGWWFLHNPVAGLIENVPGMDNRPEGLVISESVSLGAIFAAFDGSPAPDSGSWPRFRGSDFDNISKEGIGLAHTWTEGGPELLWSVDLGEGHAGPVVANGRVYLLDYDEEERADMLRCFSFANGREIWRRGYKVFIKRNHGMSRTVPAVSGPYIVTIGPKCHVMCLDSETGDFRWGIDLVKEYGAEVPLWYTGQCPLIDDTRAIFAVGGKSLLMAVDLESGEIAWETANPGNWKMSHSSVMPFTILGRKMYLYSAMGGIVAVSAEAESAGEVLFESRLWDKNVNAPSPINLGDGRIFVTAGYGAGSMMLKISENNGTYQVEASQQYKPNQGLASEQQTPILYKGHLFSILPKDAGPLRNQFVCCLPDNCGEFVWTSGKTNRFGLGPYIIADDKFYILSDDGVLTVAETNTREYRQLGQAKILDGVDAWGPLAIVDGRLLARDSHRLVCVDLRE